MIAAGASGCVAQGVGLALPHALIDGTAHKLPVAQGMADLSRGAAPVACPSPCYGGSSVRRGKYGLGSQASSSLFVVGSKAARAARKLPRFPRPPPLPTARRTGVCATQRVRIIAVVAQGSGDSLNPDNDDGDRCSADESQPDDDTVVRAAGAAAAVGGRYGKGSKEAGKESAQVSPPRGLVTRRALAGFVGGFALPSLLKVVISSRLQFVQADDSAAQAAEIFQLASYERSKVRRTRDALLVPDDLSEDLSRRPEETTAAGGGGGGGEARGAAATTEEVTTVTPPSQSGEASVPPQSEKASVQLDDTEQPAEAAAATGGEEVAGGGGGGGGGLGTVSFPAEGSPSTTSDGKEASRSDSGLSTGLGVVVAAGVVALLLGGRSANSEVGDGEASATHQDISSPGDAPSGNDGPQAINQEGDLSSDEKIQA